ncbi:MAG: hypothetical protein LBN39_03270, partial [Planctomycetaceae bacterium]|nr:hypothetical protein [Planctomycetaceae bacterium]
MSGILALVLLGLLARQAYIAHIVRWAAIYWTQLKEPLGLKSDAPPNETTISRALAKLPLEHFRQGLIAFYQLALTNEHANELFEKYPMLRHLKTITHPKFVQKTTNLRLFYLVKSSFIVLRCLTFLTGDAIFNNRPLLTVLQALGKNYLFCIKDNQPDMMNSVTQTFKDIEVRPPDAATTAKKRAASLSARFGLIQ